MSAATCGGDICCCGHARSLHPYGGMCHVCRRACDQFHKIGEGHAHPLVILAMLALCAFGGLIFWRFVWSIIRSIF